MAQRLLAGTDALDALTSLLQRCRLVDAVRSALEAADLHWWWRLDPRAEAADCAIWFDDDQPTAAVFATRFRDDVLGEIVRVPGTAITREVIEVATDLAERHATSGVLWSCPDDDVELATVLRSIGAEATDELMIEMWMPARAARDLPLPAAHRVERRSDRPDGEPHHLALRNGEHIAERLSETSLYRADLDLMVRSPGGDVAAYAVFWADPVTGVGLVEPVRVEDDHAGHGLARALVATGVRELAAAGCDRAKVSFSADNPAAGKAYAAVGFEPMATVRTYRSGV